MKFAKIVIAAVSAVLLPAGFVSSGHAEQLKQSNVDTRGVELRIATQPNDWTQALFAKSGALKNIDFKIEWSIFSSGVAANEAVIAGAVDLLINSQGTSQILAQANSKPAWTENTAPYRIVGTALQDGDLIAQAIVLQPDTTVKNFADLKGKRIGFAWGGTAHLYFAKLARDNGLKVSDFDVARLNLTDAAAAFRSGSLDAFITSYAGYGLDLVDERNAKILSTAAGYLHPYAVDIASTSALADRKKSAAIGKIIEARATLEKWVGDNQEEVIKLANTYRKENRIQGERTAQSLAKQRNVPIDQAVIGALQEASDIFVEQGVASTKSNVRLLLDDRYNSLVK